MQNNGKKFKRASSSRTCKINIRDDIKALRPHVYITDSCNFKSLVQELTGKTDGPTLFPLPPPCETQNASLLEVEDTDHHGNGSVDAIINPFVEEIMNNQARINQDDGIYVDVFASMNQYKNFLTVVESWLLDVDPCPN